MRFKLPDNARQRWPVVVNLGLFHPALPVGIIKELKDHIERLLWIVHNIGKPPTLTVFEKHIPGDCHAWQIGLQYPCHCNLTGKIEPTKFASQYIVAILSEKARANLFHNALTWVEDRKKARDQLIGTYFEGFISEM